MIDQQVPHLSPPPPAERSRRWLRRLGVTTLVSAGVAGGLFITVPVVWTVLWVGGSYLFLGDEGLEHALETVTPQEELPTPGPPPRPPVATRDADGAAAAASHFVAVYEHAYLSSDPSRLETVSTPQCVTCTSAAEALHRAQERDVRFFLVDLEPNAASVTSFTPDRAVVHLSVTTADAFVRFSSTDIRGLGGGSTENDVVLVWADGRWKVDSVDGGLWAPGLDP